MAGTRSIALSILALAAAAVALWPLAAGAGPDYDGALSSGPDIPVDAASYAPQVGSAPAAQLARYWGAPAANSTYAFDETLGVELVFSEAVTVTGVPYLELQIGSAIKKANYHEGSGTATLRFQYRVAHGDRDTDGFSINGHSAIKLNGGTIQSVTAPSRDAYTASLPVTVHGSVRNDAGHKVHGENLAPSFGSATVASQVYPPNQLIPVLDLPAATGGNGALTYSLNQTTGAPPCGTGGVSGSSGNSGVGGSSGNAIPTWMRYYAPGTTYNGATVGGGGKIAPNGTNKPTTTMSAACFELYAVDADGDNSATDRAVLSFSVAVHIDYDSNDNGLIEVASLAQLDAIRYDLNGNGAADNTADDAKYATAFPHAAAGMGCRRDHDDDAATDKIAGCTGYELTQNLDFDTDGDGATYTTSSAGVVTGDAGDTYYNSGKGWKPIGTSANRFIATFDGAGKTISNLFIKDTSAAVGLFGVVGASGRIVRLGLLNVNITGPDDAGGLVGVLLRGSINASYATGSVTGHTDVGGLAGWSDGTISASYTAATVSGSGNGVGGLAGHSSGPISDSYATGSVTGNSGGAIGGLAGFGGASGSVSGSYATGSVSGSRNTGGLIGWNHSSIIASYATGSVTGSGNSIGGLVGANTNSSSITASYATGSVSGASNVGGLVGWTNTPVSASYATGSVSGASNVGGLAGLLNRGSITYSYATGAVKGTGSNVGGLVGFKHMGTAANSYWDTGTTGQAASAGGAGVIGKTSRDLQSPAGYSGIYANWNANLDGVAGNDDPWDFGDNRQYPALKYGGLAPAQQRRVSIQSDNWNAPVVGEPVTAALNVDGAAGAVWKWQSSAAGAAWTDIAGATGTTYVPVAADAASGGKFLRAKVTFTTSGQSQTLITANTAKVIAASTATTVTGAVAFVPDVTVGVVMEYAVSGTGTTDHFWRWQRCADKEMTSGCAYIEDGAGAAAYRIAAADVGKYLRAYVYYADGSAWKRTTTPTLGPVVAAPAPPAPAPTPTPTPTTPAPAP